MRGLSTEATSNVAKSCGLSQEQVRRVFIRYKDFGEIGYFASDGLPNVTVTTRGILAFQAVNRAAVI